MPLGRPYTQAITRKTKACFLFLLDQSYSMEEPLGNSGSRKCDELVRAINGWLQNMSIQCTREEGIRDYMDVGVFGYRTENNPDNPAVIVEPAIQGPLAGRKLISISEIGNCPARMETVLKKLPDDETGELIEMPIEMPIWVDPKAEGGTPMCTMLYQAQELLAEWIDNHRTSFPPVVINITDGESQDGDPTEYADAIKEMETEDGNVLMFNCHLSMSPIDPFSFPSSEEMLPDDLAKVLFRMSSVLPESMVSVAAADGIKLLPNARGMAFNADMVALIRFLDMGTRVATQLR
jgi:hypothetical protein